MAFDLFAADLTRVSSKELFEAVKSFIRADKPIDQRPPRELRLGLQARVG